MPDWCILLLGITAVMQEKKNCLSTFYLHWCKDFVYRCTPMASGKTLFLFLNLAFNIIIFLSYDSLFEPTKWDHLPFPLYHIQKYSANNTSGCFSERYWGFSPQRFFPTVFTEGGTSVAWLVSCWFLFRGYYAQAESDSFWQVSQSWQHCSCFTKS